MHRTSSILFALITLAVASTASADDWSPISHCGSDACILIDVAQVPKDPSIAIYVYRAGTKRQDYSALLDTLDFSKECAWASDVDGFECGINPRNPLSGATYKKLQLGSAKDCGEIAAAEEYKFQCVDNCERAPRTLDVDPACD